MDKRQNDFFEFAQRQLRSMDYDPFHPVLLSVLQDADREQRAWACLLYMGFYSMGSFYTVYHHFPEPAPLPAWVDELHIGRQRRNLRATSIRRHMADVLERALYHGGVLPWLTHGFVGSPRADWYTLKATLSAVWGNGRWSAYTTAELLQKVGGLGVLPDDIGNDNSSGPRNGLTLLTGPAHPSRPVADLDHRAERLFHMARGVLHTDAIPHVKGLDYAMLESCLCDFYGLNRGSYYVGRDIDRMLGRMKKVEGHPKAPPFDALYTARASSFAPCYLGERHGWGGIRKERLTHYREHREIIDDHA